MGTQIDISKIPNGWTLFHLGSQVDPGPVSGRSWLVELRKKDSNAFVQATSENPSAALDMCLAQIELAQ